MRTNIDRPLDHVREREHNATDSLRRAINEWPNLTDQERFNLVSDAWDALTTKRPSDVGA